MSIVDGGDLVVDILKREKVTHIFSLCGGHISPIYRACAHAGIRIVDTRHEEAAVFMASAWAQITGQPGVAIVTAGPGVTGAFPGLARAHLADEPVILIGGDCSNKYGGMGAAQEIDTVSFMRTITKYARRVHDVKRIPYDLATAFRAATSGKQGPAYISIPVDEMYKKVDKKEIPPLRAYRTHHRPAGDPAAVSRAVELLRQAKQPVVICGRGVRMSGAHAQLQQFIEKGNLPLYTGFYRRADVPEDHPLNFGLVQPFFGSTAETGVQQADVVLTVGVIFDFTLGYGQPPFLHDAKVIQVNIEGADIGKNCPADVGIVGDPARVLEQLSAELTDADANLGSEKWLGKLRRAAEEVHKEAEPLLHSDNEPIHPLRLCHEIREYLPRNSTVIADSGDNLWWTMPFFQAYGPARYLKSSAYFGGLGSGIPSSLAAKLARPDEPVLAFVGDGSFGFNAMEFDTAVRLDIPIVCVIANDMAWGCIKRNQEGFFGNQPVTGVDLGLRRYDKMVEALGGHGEFVERPEEIRPALKRAFDSGKPACINVMVESLISSGTEYYSPMS